MLRAAAALVLACPLLGAVATVPTYADYASSCSAPTRTLSGGGTSSITVQAGETLLVTGGRFVGGVDAFPAGSTICVSPTATLASSYLNNASGTLAIAAGGTVDLPSVVVATGFALDNEGTFEVAGLNVNGTAELHNAAGARFAVDSAFSPAAGTFDNEGAMEIAGGLNLNGPAALDNAGTVRVRGSVGLDGALQNSGIVAATGAMTVNASADFTNECAVAVDGGLSNNASESSNDGIVRVGGEFLNNGGWTQGSTGAVAAQSLGNDGTVDGFGRYRFDGNTATQGSFTGDSASEPIVVDDLTPPSPPAIFDLQSGTVTNVVAQDVALPPPGVYPWPDCAVEPVVRSADVEVSKSAPAQVAAGDPITFTLTVTNHGPDPAVGVIVTDDLPTSLQAPVTASDGGQVGAGSVTWDLGTLAPDESTTLTVSGIAPASGTLVNTVSSSATTPDPAPQNNDGTADAATTTTDVEPIDPNSPPVAPDLARSTITGRLMHSAINATDPDPDTRLRYRQLTGPSNGRGVVFAGGRFGYRSRSDFTGIDSFTYQVCDNGTPVLCDTGTITITVYPLAWGDRATTAVDTPVRISVLDNDTDGTGPPVVAPLDEPDNGTVDVGPDGVITYTPDPGFIGADAFSYTICSPTAPTVCHGARVQVLVLPVNHPPDLDDRVLVTDVDAAIEGRASGSDVDGDDLTHRLTFPPAHGTAEVGADGALRYEPEPGYAGHDVFGVTVCDDGRPPLCSSAHVRVDVYPKAADDRASTPVDTVVTIDVVDNDSGSHVAPAVVDGPASGTVEVSGDRLVYTPDPGFAGTDRFDYRLCTPGPDPLCRTATVTVTVVPDDQGGDDGDDNGDDNGGNDGGDQDGPSGPLPDAGGPALWLSAMGALLVAGGGTVLVAARRRRTGATPPRA